ncbi:MAG: methylated-DNA--[protein]-cysteine S-methyltransferase [Pseudodonghicola sp.]|nr:methylated-DNA--[protein]-cysteine S-methyltransferase [Pseudodonghicola sp.]
MATLIIETRFGQLAVTEQDGAITRLTWGDTAEGEPSALLLAAKAQVQAYDAGELQAFDLPLRVIGSSFQQAVCAEMRAIPHGETRTYGEIARALGQPAQAVGRACGSNPIPILIPCHRVMGAGGKLTGFSGGTGVETKVALLRHEGAGGFLI